MHLCDNLSYTLGTVSCAGQEILTPKVVNQHFIRKPFTKGIDAISSYYLSFSHTYLIQHLCF